MVINTAITRPAMATYTEEEDLTKLHFGINIKR